MTNDRILAYLKGKGWVAGAALCQLLGISRQALNRHLQSLISAGRVEKQGSTRAAQYRIASGRRRLRQAISVQKTCRLKGLQEDAVFQELALRLNLKQRLTPRAARIAQYAFTEMLNNAIDHSRSSQCTIWAEVDAYDFRFRIRDFGIGIFYSIYSKFHLPDETAAVAELLKGKTTTMKEKHSGEGIFFTSKAADQLSFRSHRMTLVFDNLKRDIQVEENRILKGTEVQLAIRRRSRRDLARVFEQFAPQQFDYRFDRTQVLVRVMLADCVSRSEAKRLVHGLARFREVVLDFSGVRTLGQAFADEVFRVFLRAHPHVRVRVEQLRPALRPMVQHVIDKITLDRLTIS